MRFDRAPRQLSRNGANVQALFAHLVCHMDFIAYSDASTAPPLPVLDWKEEEAVAWTVKSTLPDPVNAIKELSEVKSWTSGPTSRVKDVEVVDMVAGSCNTEE